MVLHHDEVTYSLCSSDGELFTASLGESYRLISRALMRGLEKMGLKPILAGPAPDSYARSHMPCFAFPARDEVEIDGRKIVGSAQKRVGARFMQHGSIPLRHDEGLLKTVSCLADKESSVRMISLSQALGKEVSFDWAVEHLKEGFAEFFGIDLASKGFIPQELEAIRRIQEEKYGTARWNLEKSV
jgi:lipoate-protein ligase A